jgi:hypothetical protein
LSARPSWNLGSSRVDTQDPEKLYALWVPAISGIKKTEIVGFIQPGLVSLRFIDNHKK